MLICMDLEALVGLREAGQGRIRAGKLYIVPEVVQARDQMGCAGQGCGCRERNWWRVLG